MAATMERWEDGPSRHLAAPSAPIRAVPGTAVIMAGGYGKRLGAAAKGGPKSMVPIGERPLLLRVVERLRDAGIAVIDIAVHHRKEAIMAGLGDGSALGVDIAYIEEERPLGTAGAIAAARHDGRTLLVINGDVLTTANLRALLEFHHLQQAEMTLALVRCETTVPFGVVDLQGARVTQLTEKPKLHHVINAGIYCLEPSVYRPLPCNRPCDMTDVVQQVLARGGQVAGFPMHEYWRDIGRPEDVAAADTEIVRWEGGG
jgi:NDP-sugar pyrophosphorylase family protein